jgi:hypothetical protein
MTRQFLKELCQLIQLGKHYKVYVRLQVDDETNLLNKTLKL